MVSPLHFLRKLPQRATSRPEIEISDKRLAFSSQTPSIEPSYKTAPKQVKMSISQKVQGFLKIFRVQNVALTVRRPKHPSLVWCTQIFLYETSSRLIPRDPNLAHHSRFIKYGEYTIYTLDSGYSCTVPMTGKKSRTLEPLAFDEYCRFDTSAFYYGVPS